MPKKLVENKAYKARIERRLRELKPILQKVAKGDFSVKIEIPKKKDEFTELLVALNSMINSLRELEKERKEREVEKYKAIVERERRELAEKIASKLREELKERIAQLEEERGSLEIKVRARTRELEEERASLEQKVKERTKDLEKAKADLEAKIKEMERFHKLIIGREEKILELKEEIKKLKEELGKVKSQNK